MSQSGQNNESIWIWPFELTEKIGEGGMAEVYRARYVKDDRQVAVKLLPESTVSQPAALGRFQREMEVLKKLRHPNIVRCFGGVCENKQPFYAMELVEGGTLEDLLERVGKRSWRTTAECGLQMCAALGCAHGHGVVHRDVKPSNFLIDGDTFKLSDFGLALMAKGTKLTAADRTVGTFDYMAPEQITGKTVTPRTDLYALGIVFFEMLTGVLPFEAEDRVAVLNKHLKEPPPPISAFVYDCPPDLEVLIGDLLEKSPRDRPESAEEVAQRLGCILRGEPVPRRRRAKSKPSPDPEPDTRPQRSRIMEVADETLAAASAGQQRRGETPPAAGHWPWIVGVLTLLVCVLGARLFQLGDRTTLSPATVAAAVEDTTAKDTAVRVAGTRLLGTVGAASTDAVDRLEELCEDADPLVRVAAVRAVGKAGPGGKRLVPLLTRLQKNGEGEEVRSAAGEALRELATAGSPGGGSWWLRILGLLAFAGAVVGVCLAPSLSAKSR